METGDLFDHASQPAKPDDAPRSVKLCAKCREWKDPEEFTRLSASPDGRYSYCKPCSKIARQRSEANMTPERLAARKARAKAYQQQEHRRKRMRELNSVKRASPKGRKQTKQYLLKHKYGLTPKQYIYLLDVQQRLCASCGVPLDIERRRAHLDHCHRTGLIRGLICLRCNTTLGMVRDSEEHLQALISYIRRAKATAVQIGPKLQIRDKAMSNDRKSFLRYKQTESGFCLVSEPRGLLPDPLETLPPKATELEKHNLENNRRIMRARRRRAKELDVVRLHVQAKTL